MSRLTINVYSHNFAVSNFDHRGKEALFSFTKRYLGQWGYSNVNGKTVREMIRTYAASNARRSVFRFHINCYDEFIRTMENAGFISANFEIKRHSLFKPAPFGLKVIYPHPAYDYQTKAVDYVVDSGVSKLVEIQTGKGKGGISLRSLVPLNARTVCIVKGMYVDKWRDEFIEYYGKPKGALMIIRGSKDLKQLIELALADELEAKFIIITNTTMFNYFFEYERYDREHSYGCDPIDFFRTIKAGFRLIDELHQDYHLNFRIDLYTHIPKVLSMSATMKADDPFLNRMYELGYPLACRFEGIPFDKYIAVKALRYTLNEPRKLKWQNWIRKSYSHVMFEQSMMKNPHILANYLKLLLHVVKTSYIEVREPGQSLLIFAATVEMCTIITNFLKPQYPNLLVARYTASDDYNVFLAADIAISTLKSAGTAVDKPGLRITFMTDSINSGQANDQVLGRTRPMKGKWKDVVPEFLYLVCNDVPKQNEYHEKKVQLFSDKVLSHQIMDTGYRV